MLGKNIGQRAVCNREWLRRIQIRLAALRVYVGVQPAGRSPYAAGADLQLADRMSADVIGNLLAAYFALPETNTTLNQFCARHSERHSDQAHESGNNQSFSSHLFSI